MLIRVAQMLECCFLLCLLHGKFHLELKENLVGGLQTFYYIKRKFISQLCLKMIRTQLMANNKTNKVNPWATPDNSSTKMRFRRADLCMLHITISIKTTDPMADPTIMAPKSVLAGFSHPIMHLGSSPIKSNWV